ncbi:MAG: 2-oxoglutarate/2-oxoacid ferredoxin oxidoreductase subunit alpha, partial [Archaeoglobaceae archaeon]|nr:2-oxoglutarate/2-oxoacid ferredoxin oxidoreductase subunit alpha [Archaeoglobaceae archaeon]
MEIDIIIGGPQGAGIESAGQIALKAFASHGYEVFGSREYHSNIIGAHSYYHIKISERKKRCLSLPVDALLALDAESLFTHFMNLKDNGLLIYDSESDKKLEDLKSMDKHLKEKLLKFFQSNGLEVKSSSVAYFLKNKGVEVVALPIKSLLKEVLKRTEVTSIAKVVNVLGVTIFLQILGLEKDSIKEAIEKQFGEKARFNLIAFEVASDYIKNAKDKL